MRNPGIKPAVNILIDLKSTMEVYIDILNQAVATDTLENNISFLEAMIEYSKAHIKLADETRGTYASQKYAGLMKEIKELLQQYENKLNACLISLLTLAVEVDVEVQRRIQTLSLFDAQVGKLRSLNSEAVILTNLDTYREDFVSGESTLDEFRTACAASLSDALNSNRQEQSMWIKGLYVLLNIVMGLASAGILPAYAYITSGSMMFFPVPKTETEVVVHRLQEQLNGLEV